MPYDEKSKRHHDITNAVAYYIAKDMVLISTVGNKGLKWMLEL